MGLAVLHGSGLKCVLIVNLLMTTQSKGITAQQLLASDYFSGNRRFYHVIENNLIISGIYVYSPHFPPLSIVTVTPR